MSKKYNPFPCKFCGKVTVNSIHEKQCAFNPDRVDPKRTIPPLTKEEEWLLGHYQHLYMDIFQLHYPVLKTKFLMFKHYGYDVRFEPYKLAYKDPSVDYLRHYLVDFACGDRLFESKTSLMEFEEDPKYLYIQETLTALGKTLELITVDTFYQVMNICSDNRIPVSRFEERILENVRRGICKVRVPVARTGCDFYNRGFLRKLGDNPEKIVEKGTKIYEDKKSI